MERYGESGARAAADFRQSLCLSIPVNYAMLSGFVSKQVSRVVGRQAATSKVTNKVTASLSRKTNVRSYHERVLDHYNNPRNQGSLPKNEKGVGTGLVGAPACGDVMRLQLKISDTGVVEDAKFKTYGCGSAIASSSLATEWVKGKTVDECLTIKNTEIAKHLALPPVKLHCSMLAEDAIRAAIQDWQKKQVAKEVSGAL